MSIKKRFSEIINDETKHEELFKILGVDQPRFYHTVRPLQKAAALIETIFEAFPAPIEEKQPEPAPDPEPEQIIAEEEE